MTAGHDSPTAQVLSARHLGPAAQQVLEDGDIHLHVLADDVADGAVDGQEGIAGQMQRRGGHVKLGQFDPAVSIS